MSTLDLTLRLVSVSTLPIPHDGFIDCGTAGCNVNAVRLNALCDRQLYLNCYACRAFLIHDLRDGWIIKESSREEISRSREEARERYAPQIGQPWRDLQKMRRKAA